MFGVFWSQCQTTILNFADSIGLVLGLPWPNGMNVHWFGFGPTMAQWYECSLVFFFPLSAQKPGGLAVLKSEQRYIYNMVTYHLTKNPVCSGPLRILQCFIKCLLFLQVTKERYFNKPTYDSLRSSLQATKEHCVAHDVTELAMPRIGCGLDRLEWSKVSAIIDDVFKDSGIHITVHSL